MLADKCAYRLGRGWSTHTVDGARDKRSYGEPVRHKINSFWSTENAEDTDIVFPENLPKDRFAAA